MAYDTAMESAVLLRNEKHFLPLEKGVSVALIGAFARDSPRYQGAVKCVEIGKNTDGEGTLLGYY